MRPPKRERSKGTLLVCTLPVPSSQRGYLPKRLTLTPSRPCVERVIEPIKATTLASVIGDNERDTSPTAKLGTVTVDASPTLDSTPDPQVDVAAAGLGDVHPDDHVFGYREERIRHGDYHGAAVTLTYENNGAIRDYAGVWIRPLAVRYLWWLLFFEGWSFDVIVE